MQHAHVCAPLTGLKVTLGRCRSAAHARPMPFRKIFDLPACCSMSSATSQWTHQATSSSLSLLTDSLPPLCCRNDRPALQPSRCRTVLAELLRPLPSAPPASACPMPPTQHDKVRAPVPPQAAHPSPGLLKRVRCSHALRAYHLTVAQLTHVLHINKKGCGGSGKHHSCCHAT